MCDLLSQIRFSAGFASSSDVSTVLGGGLTIV